ncbi:hypothetical protein QBC45DRAFT_170079 [Copromyces sp. CBS 386.78]|nr:hypothetical protein QBC45DRAFT_170079 [Copromyces sp. CBS 386.78]
MLHKLPLETLNQIVSHFALTLPRESDAFPDYSPVRKHGNEDSELARHLQDRRNLRALCIVCSRCRAVASPMLYHTVILHDAAALPFFTRTLLEDPEAGNLVRDLALLIAFNNEYHERDLFNCVSPGLWADLGQWLFGEAARKTRPHEFDWKIQVASNICHSENDTLQAQVRERKLRTTELVNGLKRDLCKWSGKRTTNARPPMHRLVQGLLYCILRETTGVQRLLLQFPPNWGSSQNSFAMFQALRQQNASSSPIFCSSLVSLILASNSEAPGKLKDGRRPDGQFPLQCFRSLETLMAIGPDTTFNPSCENVKGIRHLHLLDTELQPRTLGSMLLKMPQNLISFVLKQRPSNPWYQPGILDLPTDKLPTLSEVLLLKGSELRELCLVLCYTNCFRNFIGSGKRLTCLPTLDRLEKLTIQMHLLFGDTRGFSANLLVTRLPPNLVELNILDEWEMDVAERELWLTRYVYHNEDVQNDPIQLNIEHQGDDDDENGETHFFHVLHDHSVYDVQDGTISIEAPKKIWLYSRYRTEVRSMLLDLAAQCDAGKIARQLQRGDGQQGLQSLANLRSVTYQIAPHKPLKLVPAKKHQRYGGDWPHRLVKPPVKDSMEEATAEIKAGSFLCWIPFRWANLQLLAEKFSIKDGEMSVRYIRDVVSGSEDKSDNEDESDEEDEDDDSSAEEEIGEDAEDDEAEEDDDSSAEEEIGEDAEDDETKEDDDSSAEEEIGEDAEDDETKEDNNSSAEEEIGEDAEDDEAEEDDEGYESDEVDDDENDGNSEPGESSDVGDASNASEASETSEEPDPQLLTLWNTFRKIPREHFTGVTAAFARSGVHFDCFGPSREWILAIRDAAKVVEEDL